MKLKSDKQTMIVGRGKGKEPDVVPPGDEFEVSDEDGKSLIARGLAYDPVARAKAEKQARQEAADAHKRQPAGDERPSKKPDRIAAIQEAAEQLDPDNEDHWLKDGRADTRALESILGWEVPAKERDEAGVQHPG